MEKCQPIRMKSRRTAHAWARAERRLRWLAWRLGDTPKLLRATLQDREAYPRRAA